MGDNPLHAAEKKFFMLQKSTGSGWPSVRP